MKINKIIKLKNYKYKIVLDNETLITYEDVILKNNILYNKEINEDVYNSIINDNNFYEIYYKVVKYVTKKRRSEKEVKEYIKDFNLSDDDTAEIISKLKKCNLLNDIEYCRAFINDKIYLSKNGINSIRIDLLNQGIDIEIIEEELKNIDGDFVNKKLEKIIIKKIKNNKKYSNTLLKQKILNEMINLGYKKENILQIIDDNLEDNNIIENEFKKIYSKLSNKYEAKELIVKIKQKLLLKGFKSEEINNLIDRIDN